MQVIQSIVLSIEYFTLIATRDNHKAMPQGYRAFDYTDLDL